MGSTNSQRPINRSRVLQLCTCVNARMHKQDQKNERNAVKMHKSEDHLSTYAVHKISLRESVGEKNDA